MPDPDRRTFLRAAGHLGVGVAAANAATALGDSLPPPTPPEGALKRLEGTGVMPLPAGAARRLGDTRMRILGHINALQFSPTGTTLVSATSGELRGWDPRTGKVLFRLDFPAGVSVDSGRLTSRDTFLLMVRPNSGQSQELRQYAFGTGKLVSRSPGLKFDNSQRTAFAADGTLMVVVHNEALSVHDTATGKEKWRQPLPADAVPDCQFFPDGSTVAVAGKGEVRLFATASGKPGVAMKATITGNAANIPPPGGRGADWVSDLAISGDGRSLAASVGEDEDVVLCWDTKAGTVKHQFRPAAKPIGFSPDGSELATVHGGLVTFWVMATGKLARRFAVPRGEAQLSPDGKVLAVAAGDAAVLIDAGSGKNLPHSADPPGLPTALRFVGPERLQGRLDDWGGWVDWDLKTGSATLVRAAGTDGQIPVSLSADGRVALLRREKGREYAAVDVATGKTVRSAKGADDEAEAGNTLAITPDGTALIGPADEGLAVVTDAGRRVVARMADAPGVATAIATDGRTAALAYQGSDNGGVIDLFDLAAGRFLRRLTTNGSPSFLAFGPGGNRLLVGHDEQGNRRHEQRETATIFDLRTGKPVFRATPDDNNREHVFAYSPDGRMVARAGDRGRIALWDIHASQVRLSLETSESASVSALAFAPDGRTLAASVNGGPVFLWDLYPGPVETLTAVEIECAWWALHTDDAATAFGAIQLLARDPGRAVPLLRERVAAVDPPDPHVVDRHIADLDHKEFRKREAAGRALAALGERANEPMAKALTASPGPEVRERLEKLLAATERPTPDQLRRVRAVEIAEVIGTPEATTLLAHWAGGASGAQFTTEAMVAAKRVAERAK
jgi:WD40 repeat protein